MSRSHPPRPGQHNALQWLHQHQLGASLLATAQQYAALQQAVRAALPPALRKTCQVAGWQDMQLRLHVPSAAHSARLRQTLPSLMAALRHAGWQVEEIRVKVQGQADTRVPQPPREPRPPLGPEGATAWRDLHAVLRPGPLADAVGRLLRHMQD